MLNVAPPAQEAHEAGEAPDGRLAVQRTEGGRAGRTRLRRGGVAAALLGLLGAVTLAAAWVVATPMGGNPDEPDHLYYAWAVTTGQAFGEDARIPADTEDYIVVTVPTELVGIIPFTCYAFDSAVPVNRCSEAPPPGGETDVRSHMRRYPVAFYVPAGLVMRATERLGLGPDGILYSTRTAGALLCLSLVAGGVLLLARRYGALTVTVVALLATTPMAWYVMAGINPSGLEVASTFLLVAAALAVRFDARTAGRPGPVPLAALVVAVALAAGARPLSVVWAGIAVAVLLLPVATPTGRRAVSALPRWVVAVVPASLGLGLAWLAWAAGLRGDDSVPGRTDLYESFPVVGQLGVVVLRFGEMVRQAVGVLGWLDTPLPTLFLVLWLVVAGVVVARWSLGRSADAPRWVVPAALALGAAVVVAHSWPLGYGWQGRYMLPVFVITTLLTVPGLADAARRGLVSRRLLLAVGALLALLHAFAVLWTYGRHAYGLTPVSSRLPRVPVPAAAEWVPVGGVGLLVALAAVAAVLLLASLAVAARLPPPVDDPAQLPRVSSPSR